MSDLLRANYYYSRSPGQDVQITWVRGHCQILSPFLWNGLFPAQWSLLQGARPVPEAVRSHLWASRHLSLATLCCRHQPVPLCLPAGRSMGAPEDRSSLTHPCVPKAPDSGCFHHCPDATPTRKEAAPGNGRSTQAHRQGASGEPPASTICPRSHRTQRPRGSTGGASAQPGRSRTRALSPSAPLGGSPGSDLGFSNWLKATQCQGLGVLVCKAR